jgi:hypothetical protein
MRRLIALAAALGAALAAPARPALGCDALREVRAEVDALPPALAGMRMQAVRTLGAQLVLENPTTRTVEVLDADGVPFVRVGPRGVEANLGAAAWSGASGTGATHWRVIGSAPSYGWFEPRVDAARVALPPVLPARGAPIDVGAWSVPLRVDGVAVALRGRFRYRPPAAGAYVARLTSSATPADGVRVTLLRGPTTGLLIENTGAQPLLVFGRDGEPVLRIGRDGVEANLRSPTWAASGRAAADAAPAAAGAAPHWRRVAAQPRYSWIDPRAAAPLDPPNTAADERAWQVPVQVGEQRLPITGVLIWRSAAS